MNISTFGDAAGSRKRSLADELADDDDEEEKVLRTNGRVEGEEEDTGERFNEGGDSITPFNMKEERESGFIDDDMNFIFKKEKAEVDSWVAGLEESEGHLAIASAALAEKRRQARAEALEHSRRELEAMNEQDLKRELLLHLKPGETVKVAMRRLGGATSESSSSSGGIKRRKAPGSTAPDILGEQKKLSAAEKIRLNRENRAAIERITELADRLMSMGNTAIYSMSFEAVGASTSLWEYKGADGNIHGPFSATQIAAWKQQGFLTGPTAVMMRRVLSVRQPRRDVVGQKRARFSDENDDADSAKRARPADGSQFAGAASEAVDGEEEWKSSDAIDFGEVVDLSSAARGMDAFRSHGSGKSKFEAESDDEDVPSRQKQKDSDDDDDDDDDDN